MSGASHLEVVQLLLDREADVNFPNQVGDTPFMAATANEHYDVAPLLLDHGTKIE